MLKPSKNKKPNPPKSSLKGGVGWGWARIAGVVGVWRMGWFLGWWGGGGPGLGGGGGGVGGGWGGGWWGVGGVGEGGVVVGWQGMAGAGRGARSSQIFTGLHRSSREDL